MRAQPTPEVLRLRLLSDAAGDLLAADDPDRMLQDVFHRASRQLEIDVYFNFMVDEPGKTLRLASCGGVRPAEAQKLTRLRFGQAICGSVAERCEAVCAAHIQESDDPVTAAVKGLGIRAYACNPLCIGESLLGTLSFGSRTKDRFSEEDLELFRAISRCVTIACERLRSENALRASQQALRQSRGRLVEQMRRLEEQDRRKNEFIAVLGHELRNPLAAVDAGIRLLAEGLPAPAATEVTDRVTRQIGLLGRLLNDLLDLSRISRGKIELRRTRCDLREVVERGAEALRASIEERCQTLELDLPRSVSVRADPTRIEQVLTNLLSNASSYTPEGGGIRVSLGLEGDRAQVRVRDTGQGLTPEARERIFEAFVQEQEGRGGLGIGLAVARQIVELHGGRLRAESDGPDRGSEFRFQLPAAEPAGAPEQGSPRERAAKSSGVASGHPPLAGLRVLLVDDNRDSALALSLLLRRRGCTVRVAHTGAEGCASALEERPDVVLLDIGLPDMDGCAVARTLREAPSLAGISLLALTGFGDARTRQRAAEAGFEATLVKPVAPRTLYARLAGARDRALGTAAAPPEQPSRPTEAAAGSGAARPVRPPRSRR